MLEVNYKKYAYLDLSTHAPSHLPTLWRIVLYKHIVIIAKSAT